MAQQNHYQMSNDLELKRQKELLETIMKLGDLKIRQLGTPSTQTQQSKVCPKNNVAAVIKCLLLYSLTQSLNLERYHSESHLAHPFPIMLKLLEGSYYLQVSFSR